MRTESLRLHTLRNVTFPACRHGRINYEVGITYVVIDGTMATGQLGIGKTLCVFYCVFRPVSRRRRAAADHSIERRGSVAVPNSSMLPYEPSELNTCSLFVCFWSDILARHYTFLYVAGWPCSPVVAVGKGHISCMGNKRAVRTRLLDRWTHLQAKRSDMSPHNMNKIIFAYDNGHSVEELTHTMLEVRVRLRCVASERDA